MQRLSTGRRPAVTRPDATRRDATILRARVLPPLTSLKRTDRAKVIWSEALIFALALASAIQEEVLSGC